MNAVLIGIFPILLIAAAVLIIVIVSVGKK
jgi:hypothetical protein